MREIPPDDLPRTAVDHAHQVRPAHCRTRPDLGHVRLPDLIWLGCFHPSPLFLPSCAQTPRAHQQPTLAHHTQYAFAIHEQSFLPLQPPRHSPIAVPQLLSAGHHHLLIVGAVSPTASRPLPVVQTRPPDDHRRRHQRSREALRQHLSCLGLNRTTPHSPTPFFSISTPTPFP